MCYHPHQIVRCLSQCHCPPVLTKTLLEVNSGKVKFSGEETTGSSTPGLANPWPMCQQWCTERFAWHATFTAALFFLCLTSISVLYRIIVYKHIPDCIDIVYELPLVPDNTMSETFLHRSGVMRGGVPAWW